MSQGSQVLAQGGPHPGGPHPPSRGGVQVAIHVPKGQKLCLHCLVVCMNFYIIIFKIITAMYEFHQWFAI